ncbi:TlpA family protein disulfide reductase [bacterium]|nr:TlpA family protein disulfide reductase [bacterium]
MRLAVCIALPLICLLAACTGKDSNTEEIELVANTQAPSFELKDLQGQTRSLQSFAGKTILLNFWATWCGPCIAEIPALIRLQTKLGSEKFQVLSISVDSDPQALAGFIKANAVNYPVLIDPDYQAVRRYGVQGFPETFIIDRDGRLQAIADTEEGRSLVRIVRDRPWDSEAYLKILQEIIAK